MILDTQEMIGAIDQMIREKEDHLEAIRKIDANVHNVTNLDSLKGEGGGAIKQHFNTLHTPVLLLLQHFIETYINNLTKVKDNLINFDTENAFVSAAFLDDLDGDLNNVINYSEDTADSINTAYGDVSDLISTGELDVGLLIDDGQNAKEHLKKVVENLDETDNNNNSILKESKETLSHIGELSQKVVGWSSNGVMISDETASEIEAYFEDSYLITTLIDEAVEFAEENNDPTTMGRIGNWIDTLGDVEQYRQLGEQIIAASVLGSKLVSLESMPDGSYRVVTKGGWQRGAQQSKVAESIHKVLDKGDSSSWNPVRRWLGSFGNQADGVLKDLAGISPKADRIRFGERVMDKNSPFLKFNEDLFRQQRVSVDWKETGRQLRSIGNVAKKIPVLGTGLILGMNTSEYFKDENQDLSGWEKTGRYLAGVGFDITFSGVTAGATLVGTMASPVIGTIGGATVGIIINMMAEDAWKESVMDKGQEVGKWAEETWNDITDTWTDMKEGVNEFVGDWFR